jgi:hypothetical protein
MDNGPKTGLHSFVSLSGHLTKNWYAFYAREVIQQVMVHLISTHISIVFIWPWYHIELSMHIHCCAWPPPASMFHNARFYCSICRAISRIPQNSPPNLTTWMHHQRAVKVTINWHSILLAKHPPQAHLNRRAMNREWQPELSPPWCPHPKERPLNQ